MNEATKQRIKAFYSDSIKTQKALEVPCDQCWRVDVIYAGDVGVSDVWKILKENSQASLIDVRTLAELSFVGQPDLSSLQQSIINIEWQHFPDMQRNVDFSRSLLSYIDGRQEQPIFFLCRSGARSAAAAAYATGMGFHQAYNIAFGFEGDIDETGHRGNINGWKADKLPWRQT